MAVSKQGMVDARTAGEDLSEKLMYIAKLNSSEEAVLAGNDEVGYGVITEAAAQGAAATLQISGIAKVVASGAINAGAKVAVAAGGKAKAGTTNPIGVARSTVSADGEVVEVNLDA